jgi:hypothetical protein
MYAVDFTDFFKVTKGTLQELRQALIHCSVYHLIDYGNTITSLCIYENEIGITKSISVTSYLNWKSEQLIETPKEYESSVLKVLDSYKPRVPKYSRDEAYIYVDHKSSMEKVIRYKEAKEYLDLNGY